MKARNLALAFCNVCFLAAFPCFSQTTLGPYTVNGWANPYLAAQPTGVTCCMGPTPTTPDSVPEESPTQVVGFLPGDILTMAVTGGMSHGGGTPVNADGTGSISMPDLFGPTGTAVLTLGRYTGPIDTLLGVFLAGSQPATQPAGLNFTASGTSFATLSPLIGQVFYIGDGLTGSGSGSPQRFTVPSGATALYLGGSDSYGYRGNTGTFTVTVTDLATTTPVTPSVPAVSPWGLALIGVLLAGITAWVFRPRVSA